MGGEAEQVPGRYVWEGPSQDKDADLRRLSAQQLREVSRAFRETTAETYDGTHVCHFCLLSDEGLEVLALLLSAVECSGIWPAPVQPVALPLIPKPAGGHRPIGLFAGIYRLWAKARRPLADEWERAHPRAYFSAEKGNRPVDTLWRQAARLEAAICCGGQAGAVMTDMASFYELIDREVLVKEAVELNVPVALVRTALAAYAAPRLITMHGNVARELYPQRGIVAGCPLATTFVKVYYLRPFDALVNRMPTNVEMDVHIDDIMLTNEGGGEGCGG